MILSLIAFGVLCVATAGIIISVRAFHIARGSHCKDGVCEEVTLRTLFFKIVNSQKILLSHGILHVREQALSRVYVLFLEGKRV